MRKFFSLVCLCLALFLLAIFADRYTTEARFAGTELAAADAAVDGDPERIDPAQEGRLLIIQGRLHGDGPLRDEQLGTTHEGVGLRRVPETYCWEEKKEPTLIRYVLDWTQNRRPSKSFVEWRTHENPEDVPLGWSSWEPKKMLIGSREITKLPLSARELWQTVPFTAADVAHLPDPLRKITHLQDGLLLLTGPDPVRHIGDQRVHRELIREQDVTVLMAQQGKTLVPWKSPNGQEVAELVTAKVSTADLAKRESFGDLNLTHRQIEVHGAKALLSVSGVLLLAAALLWPRR